MAEIYSVQMDAEGNFVEETLSSAQSASNDTPHMGISFRDVTNERQSLTVGTVTPAEQAIAQAGRQAQEYFERNVAPLLGPQAPGETDAQYSRRMGDLQRHSGLYQLQTELALDKAELARMSDTTEKASSGITPEGYAQLKRELQAQQEAETARDSNEFK